MPHWGIGTMIGIFNRYNSIIACKPSKYGALVGVIVGVWVAVILCALPSLIGAYMAAVE